MTPLETLAREAADTCGKTVEYHCDRVWLERFAALVRAEALEEAARVCDDKAYTHPNASMLGPEQNAVKCAAAIRALKT